MATSNDPDSPPRDWKCYLCGLPHEDPLHTPRVGHPGATVRGAWMPAHDARYILNGNETKEEQPDGKQ